MDGELLLMILMICYCLTTGAPQLYQRHLTAIRTYFTRLLIRTLLYDLVLPL